MSTLSFGLTFFHVVSIVISVLAFGTAFWLYRWVSKQPSSNKRIAEVGGLIRDGANTFLSKEYKTLARFSAVVAILILVFFPSPIWKGQISNNLTMAIAYILVPYFLLLQEK